MILTWWHFAVVCPLVGLAGFIDAVAGGGGLISLPAYILAGLPAHQSIGTNKLSSTMGTSLSVWRYGRNGLIPWSLIPWAVVCSFAGSRLGAGLTLWLTEALVSRIMLIVLPLTAIYLLFGKKFNAQPQPREKKVTLILSMIIAFLIGAYDGFYGPGTGTFLLLCLNGLAHLPLTRANGMSKVLNLTSNVTALYVFLSGGVVLLPLGLTAGVFSLIGNWLGTKVFISRGSNIARPVILAVLALFFFKILLF